MRAPNGICRRFLGLSNRSGAVQGFVRDAGVSGLNGAKKAELMRRVPPLPAQLEDMVPMRSYKLTTTGQALLDAHPRGSG